MVGHVNMMDDVLISNLPPEYLRSALRALISQGSSVQQPFVRHVRERLLDPKPELYPAQVLFPGPDELATECTTYLALTRCLFSSKMVQLSLSYLDHFSCSLHEANANWTIGSELHKALGGFAGDIVQAMQALKEIDPPRDDALKAELLKLHTSLVKCRHYCETHEPNVLDYPFQRSERQVADVVHILYPDHPAIDKTGDEYFFPSDVSLSEITETFTLGPFEAPRLFNGFWQLSSPAWGTASSDSQNAALSQLLRSGLVAADMADHYGDAELVYGHFRNSLPPQVKDKVFAATKWCVFKPIGCEVTDKWVLEAVKERCRRLGGRVELLQFHWYDYGEKEYLDILVKLISLTKTHPRLVSSIGLCNFDSAHTQEACDYLLDKTGVVGLVSNQIQFSVVDSRPLWKMCSISAKYGLKLLTYGSFCGGFLSSRWLNQRLPEMYSASCHLTPSQRKYLGMICDWGSWEDFQTLLSRLSTIAEKHGGLSLTSVAIRWVLQKPSVGAVIVGTRLGVATHDQDNLTILNLTLDDDDMKAIDEVALGSNNEKAGRLIESLGDCGNEYRNMH
ncbi:putative aryl-alcohol dehydrogenase [Xylaria bambusicola]|uniref:putative aryl-alcohol dehydrogenase n=1 Tax=Xylaria bambusicola TaxID=326684 RepID=UPI0020086FBF|nr:putative aryl-alcohol dehydrogenase [Xylaria bambusicola]KAI0517087.1 putative aryl-alcohol dehydrogenase [Xylaria bambusicola]